MAGITLASEFFTLSSSLVKAMAYIVLCLTLAALASIALPFALPLVLTVLALHYVYQSLLTYPVTVTELTTEPATYPMAIPIPFALEMEQTNTESEIDEPASDVYFSQEEGTEIGVVVFSDEPVIAPTKLNLDSLISAVICPATFPQYNANEAVAVIEATASIPVTICPETLPTPASGSKAYDTMSQDELVSMAKRLGIRANKRWNRDTIIAKIEQIATFAEAV